jgi:hypothetical protein
VICAVIGLQVISRSRPLLFLFNAGHGIGPVRKAAGRDVQAARTRAG